MRKKRRVWPHTAALARSDIRAPAVRARVINLAIVPSAARSSPASPLSVAYLLGDPAARSNKGELFMDQDANQRDLLLASVMTAALPFGISFSVSGASASPINPAETIIKLPADLAWKPNPNNPPRSSDSCALAGSPTEPGLYYTLVRWWPGYMSAPHTYTSDVSAWSCRGRGGATAATISIRRRACPRPPAASCAGSPARRITTA
jgi:hypothetical protein